MNEDQPARSPDGAAPVMPPVDAATAEPAVQESAATAAVEPATEALAAAQPAVAEPAAADHTPRPIIERIGLALIAIVLGSLFGVVAAAAWNGGEPFLAAMGGIGCLMTFWVGGLTLFRG